MNSLLIPSSPNWYEPNVLTCALDGTLVYGAFGSLVIINPKPADQPTDIKLINPAHNERICGVSVNPNWGKDRKLAVTAADDKLVKLWDCETLEVKQSHDTHTSKLCGVTFAGTDKVISVSKDGCIVLWKINTNEITTMVGLLGKDVQVTSLASCPHAPWLTAFGLKNGAVMVIDMRKKGSVKFRLKAHLKSIYSLSWCPLPYNIFPRPKVNKLQLKSKTINDEHSYCVKENLESLKIQELNEETQNKDHIDSEAVTQTLQDNTIQENSQKSLNEIQSEIEKLKLEAPNKPTPKKNPWIDLKFPDDDDFKNDPENETTERVDSQDFLAECAALRNKIVNTVDVALEDAEKSEGDDFKIKSRKILKAVKRDKCNELINTEIPMKESDVEDSNVELPQRDVGIESLNDYLKDVEFKNSNKELADTEIKSCIMELPQKDVFLSKDSNAEIDANIEIKNCDRGLADNELPQDDIEIESFIKDSTAETNTNIENKNSGGGITDKALNCVIELPQKDIGMTNAELNQDFKVEVHQKTESLEVNEATIENLLKETKQLKISLENTSKTLENVISDDNKNDKVEDVEMEMEEALAKDFLLASSSKDGDIIIWRAGTNGKMQVKMSVPNKSKPKNNYRNKNNNVNEVYIALHWITPSILLSSGTNGEMLKWNLLNSNKSSTVIHDDHHSKLFTITAQLKLYTDLPDCNWRELTGLGAWTFGIERSLLYTTIDGQSETLRSYPTLGNYVNYFAVSPVDPNRVALSTADNTIRVWNLSRPHLQYVTMSQVKLRQGMKVSALAWHLEQDVILAFSTEDGQIGLVNVGTMSKPPVMYAHYFRNVVYKLEWKPPAGSSKSFSLYACSEGAIAVYDADATSKAPSILQIPKEERVTHFSWKPNYKLLAVATRQGTIYLFSDTLEPVGNLYYQQKSIISMCWHPEATAEDEESSPYQHWLATTTVTDGTIVIYDLKDLTTGNIDIANRIVAELNVHVKYVRALNWSPHVGALLVSASEDGTAHVWDVKNNKVVATFMNTMMYPITACIWSPLDKNYVITGGREWTIRIWNINEHLPKTQEDVLEERNKRKNVLSGLQQQSHQSSSKDVLVKEAEFEVEKLFPKDVLLSSVTSRQRNKDVLLEDCRKLVALNEIEEDAARNELIGNNRLLQLFGGRDNVIDLLDNQRELLKEKSNYTYQQHLSLWKGDIGETIKNSIENEKLTPWLISLAPMVSPKLWQEACESYANSLSKNPSSNAVEIASYYLSCHKITEAVNILCDRSLYREALALAKCRIPQDETTINQILEKWAALFNTHGQFEISTQCYISLGKYEEAAKMLNKRSDALTLEFAAELAEKSKNVELYNSIKYRYERLKGEEKSVEEKPLPTRMELFLSQESAREENKDENQ